MSQMHLDLESTLKKSSKSAPKILSITQANRLIKNQLETEFSSVWLQGEVSNFKPHSSGHHYFSLKDSGAQISAVMFRGVNSKLKFQPKNGMEVIIRGKITVYEPRGNYQIICDKMEPLGAGALQQSFEQLKSKLRNEGLFSPEHKKPLPLLPKHVALVTSATGAAVKDMLNVLRRRSKSVQITVVPSVVQGDSAPGSIVNALVQANSINDVDVIIVGRGGGSMEDLWGFNSELVARAIFSCSKPVISAVGHEVDFTIADFVADLRAPTPSAAAELVIENSDNLQSGIDSLNTRLKHSLVNFLKYKKQTIQNYETKLKDPRKYLEEVSLKVDDSVNKMENYILNRIEKNKMQIDVLKKSLINPRQLLEQKKSDLSRILLQLKQNLFKQLESAKFQLNTASVKLDSISPLKVVHRGYAIVSSKGKVLKESKQVKNKDEINIKLAKGELIAIVKSVVASKE